MGVLPLCSVRSQLKETGDESFAPLTKTSREENLPVSRLNIVEDAKGRQSLPMLPQPSKLCAVLSNCNRKTVPLQIFATVTNSATALMGSPVPSSPSMNYPAPATMAYPAPLAPAPATSTYSATITPAPVPMSYPTSGMPTSYYVMELAMIRMVSSSPLPTTSLEVITVEMPKLSTCAPKRSRVRPMLFLDKIEPLTKTNKLCSGYVNRAQEILKQQHPMIGGLNHWRNS
ncbi:hypothetical protein OUZ56_016501 [Daphnia magna]|uniref:Uncharacterized protein n=1 Tax=Daphnia magna TaxID=35525 RepID=A0ABR0AQV0_9CRUS|nr:hypothetical protein OUZ56_016501 [Daphnia magna]